MKEKRDVDNVDQLEKTIPFVTVPFIRMSASWLRVSSSMRKSAIKDITPISVELCETAVCFLHIQLSGTKVRLPKMHKTSPDLDLKYSRSPAKSAS